MSRKTRSQILAHWPLALIMATLIGWGWYMRGALAADIERAERRINERVVERLVPIRENVRIMQNDLRAIRDVVAPIINRIPPP